MIGDAADQRRQRLGRIDPAHARPHRIAPRCDLPRVAEVAGRAADQVAVQCQHHVRGIGMHDEVERPAVCQLAAAPDVVARHRLPLLPRRLRVAPQQGFQGRAQGRGDDAAGEDSEAVPLRLREPGALAEQVGLQRLRAREPPGVHQPGRAVRIIEIQQHRLAVDAGRTEASGVLRIALDLDRPAHLVGDDDARRGAAVHQRGRVAVGLSGHDIGGRPDRDDKVVVRRARVASREAAKRHAGSHQAQHAPPRFRPRQRARQCREFAGHPLRVFEVYRATASGALLSVAYRAIGQVAVWHVVMRQQRRLRGRGSGAVPVGVVDRALRPQVRPRVAVAGQTELHRQRRRLVGQRHLRDMAVAGLAAHAFGDVDRVVEVDVVGQVVDLPQTSGLFSARLWRTGANRSALVQICEWQVMQVQVGGRPARSETSTEAWQNRQSMPRPATWCSWLNGTGWSTVNPTLRTQSVRGASHHHPIPPASSSAAPSRTERPISVARGRNTAAIPT